jgi:hypothetical protein
MNVVYFLSGSLMWLTCAAAQVRISTKVTDSSPTTGMARKPFNILLHVFGRRIGMPEGGHAVRLLMEAERAPREAEIDFSDAAAHRGRGVSARLCRTQA